MRRIDIFPVQATRLEDMAVPLKSSAFNAFGKNMKTLKNIKPTKID